MKFPRLLIAFAAVLLGVAAVAQEPTGEIPRKRQGRPEENTWPEESFRDVPYKQVGGRQLLMDIYRPTAAKSTKAPLIYYVHGGGWAAGNKESFNTPLMLPVFRQLADKGFVCVAVSYRLSIKGQNVLMRDCVTDAMDGLRFLKMQAQKYGIDPERIVVFGASAGGQIIQMLNYTGPDGFPGDKQLVRYGVQPLAGISWYGPTDFTDVAMFKTDLEDKNPDRFGDRITGGAGGYTENPKAYEEMSSYFWIRADSPPLLLMQGDTDPTIPFVHATHLKAKADRIGADVTLVMVEHASHNWRKAGGDPKPDLQEIQRITVQYALRQAGLPLKQSSTSKD